MPDPYQMPQISTNVKTQKINVIMQKISSKIVITNNVDFVDKSHQIKVQINCTD